MGRIKAFLFLSLDGFYKDEQDGTSSHEHGEDESRFSEKQLSEGDILVFGRKTYEMMAAFWPGPLAAQQYPEVARGMNSAQKIVLSRTLAAASWNNTVILSENTLMKLKELATTKNLTILGSGTIVRQLINAQMLDELELMIDPLLLGGGTSLLAGLERHVQLVFEHVHLFSSGKVLLRYRFNHRQDSASGF